MIHKHLTTLAMARSGHNFVIQNILSWQKDREIYIHHNLESISPKDLTPNHLQHGGKRVIIYRDFKNWLASLITMSYRNRATRDLNDIPTYLKKVVPKYFDIIQEIKHPQYFPNAVPIYYDEFFLSREYRKKMCEELGDEYSEEMIDHVPRNGHGSSFDGRELDGHGSKMSVLNRHEQILASPQKDLYLKTLKEYGQI